MVTMSLERLNLQKKESIIKYFFLDIFQTGVSHTYKTLISSYDL